jgi:hypothetical protein
MSEIDAQPAPADVEGPREQRPVRRRGANHQPSRGKRPRPSHTSRACRRAESRKPSPVPTARGDRRPTSAPSGDSWSNWGKIRASSIVFAAVSGTPSSPETNSRKSIWKTWWRTGLPAQAGAVVGLAATARTVAISRGIQDLTRWVVTVMVRSIKLTPHLIHFFFACFARIEPSNRICHL